jgi:hypothetical protein
VPRPTLSAAEMRAPRARTGMSNRGSLIPGWNSAGGGQDDCRGIPSLSPSVPTAPSKPATSTPTAAPRRTRRVRGAPTSATRRSGRRSSGEGPAPAAGSRNSR